jgi:outer membrane protein assembly factor BamB
MPPLSRLGRLCALLAAAAALIEATVRAEDWPQWRGPLGTGVSAEQNLPVTWSGTQNVAWRAALGGVGVSSPIVTGSRVFVTSQMGSGASSVGPRLAQGGEGSGAERSLTPSRAGSANAAPVFLVEAFDRDRGTRLWQYRLSALGPMPTVHDKHNMASPSPVTDGSLVYAWFSTGQIVALDLEGRLVWQRHLGREIAPFEINWGHSSSPVLFEDLLVLLCDHQPASYLLAVDKRTGRERWKADRGQGRQSYSTPFVVRTSAGPELIVNSSARVDAYDPRTGAPLWHVGGENRFPIPSPAFHDGVLYLSRGYRSGPYMAVRPGGRGDVTRTHVLWEAATGAPYISSLVYDAGLIYMTSDVGGFTVLDATTGARVWQQRVNGIFSASPVVGDGKVYLVSETGTVVVVRSGRRPEVLATNEMGVRLMASPAIAAGRLYLRSDDELFAVGPR